MSRAVVNRPPPFDRPGVSTEGQAFFLMMEVAAAQPGIAWAG